MATSYPPDYEGHLIEGGFIDNGVKANVTIAREYEDEEEPIESWGSWGYRIELVTPDGGPLHLLTTSNYHPNFDVEGAEEAALSQMHRYKAMFQHPMWSPGNFTDLVDVDEATDWSEDFDGHGGANAGVWFESDLGAGGPGWMWGVTGWSGDLSLDMDRDEVDMGTECEKVCPGVLRTKAEAIAAAKEAAQEIRKEIDPQGYLF